MVGSIDHPHVVSTGNPRPPNATRAMENDLRLLHKRRPRSPITILTSIAPSRLDYRHATRSGLAASAVSSSPPLRLSPPLRSARLVSTISDRPALNITPPTAPPKSDSQLHAAPLPTPSGHQLHFLQPTVHSQMHPGHNLDSPPHMAPSHSAATDINVETAAAGLSDFY